MFPSYLLALREGIEAALIIGIVLGALRRLGRMDCAHVVWRGAGLAAFVSLLAAVSLNVLGWSFDGAAEPIFEGVMLLVAAGLLTWMIVWMRQQAQHLRSGLEAGVRQAVCSPGHRAVFVLSFVAIAREGVELALFLTAASFEAKAGPTLGGAFAGLATAALLGWLLFNTAVRLDLRRFFQVTSALLILFAAGMIATAVHEFNELGWIPALVDPLWSTRDVLSEKSTAGALLKGIFGYTSSPSLTAVLAYATYLAAMLIRFGRRPVRPATPARTGPIQVPAHHAN